MVCRKDAFRYLEPGMTAELFMAASVAIFEFQTYILTDNSPANVVKMVSMASTGSQDHYLARIGVFSIQAVVTDRVIEIVRLRHFQAAVAA